MYNGGVYSRHFSQGEKARFDVTEYGSYRKRKLKMTDDNTQELLTRLSNTE